ncbi:MAG: hypothetical protein RBS39_07210 [Phycisphaerales bacterium]|jgi:hypothetical protein|nr:hypothetical protein [Phycisphaerales bacterium]
MIDTKIAERRPVSYASFDDLARGLDLLEAAHRAGTLRHTANWTPGHLPGPFHSIDRVWVTAGTRWCRN